MLEIEHLSDPKIGYLDLDLKVDSKSTSSVNNNYKILLVAENGEDKFKTFALNTPSKPDIYKCVFDLEKNGEWHFYATISENNNKEEILEFSIIVEGRNRETSPFSASFYLFGLIFLTIFLAPLYIFRKTIF